MKRLLSLALALALTLSLVTGCAVFKAAEERPVLTELAVRAAVARVLEERPAWVEPTARITADAIRLLTHDETVTLADLEGYVLQQIPWADLAPEESEMLRVLVRAVREETEIYLQRQGITDPGAVGVGVARVLSWINQTAEIRRA